MLLFSLEAEVSANSEPSKHPKRPTGLDNPSELIKIAQKELVINNMSNKEEGKKAKDTEGMLHVFFFSPIKTFFFYFLKQS